MDLIMFVAPHIPNLITRRCTAWINTKGSSSGMKYSKFFVKLTIF